MVEPAVAQHVPERTGGAGLGFPGTEDHCRDPGQHQRTGAHRAGFEGHHEGAAVQPPVSQPLGRPAQTQPATEGDAVSRERAGEIALAQAGGGRITETDRDEENGRAIWEVEIVNGGTEHEIDVDRQSGEIVKAEQEPADEDEDDRDEDDRDDD
ncbi:hypothetical protein ENC19_27775 [Verrucosispora sp. CWR15]|uniref:PepSY domain-containing protein n=1 Tax=Verrucosispora sioxanthis TaxID=2499994 RepID=A0A6M1LCX7_9ACTN|nr:hypothetical protein [Verrucosispora sioxanthis]NGM16158.1 hypothetical protein [Verrucosispora sioxanthis]